MHRTQIQLTSEQLQILRGRAAELGISISALIRDLADREGASLSEARETAVRSIGGFHSGSSDGSRDHDRHLGEAFYE